MAVAPCAPPLLKSLMAAKREVKAGRALARRNRSHLRAHLAWYGVVLESQLRVTKAAAFPLHDEIPQGIGGGSDQARPLRAAPIGRGYCAARLFLEGVQGIEGVPQFPGKAADRRRLLLTDLVLKDVVSCPRSHRDDPLRGAAN